MDSLEIEGGYPLKGTCIISGAKNSALPILASSIIFKGTNNITNCPNVVDINTLAKLITMLGGETSFKNSSLDVNTDALKESIVLYEIMRKMRASILLLGPLLARFKQAQVSLPGGCAIGARPVDLHIKAIQKMGAEVEIKGGYISAKTKGLKGADIIFDRVTVTGTENIIMAAALAKGTTKIINAAKEPEVAQLCLHLQNGGLEINGIGTNEIEIRGRDGELLNACDVAIIPDRIEAGTYLCAGAITNSNITLSRVNPQHLENILSKLKEIGFSFRIHKDAIDMRRAKSRLAFELTTSEYPGFPTDMQAQFMALATQCEGTSIIKERLFENRFMHVNELQRLGAQISLLGNVANIKGASPLIAADVMATDLRASSALVLASLVAEGTSKVSRIYHLDRGYERLEEKLATLGAKIKRIKNN